MVQAAIRAAQRGAQLTEQLLAYSRRQRLNPVLLDVNRMVGEIGELITRAHGEPVVLHLSLSPELGPVKADTLQLQSAILNLILNARDAMPQGGTLMIQTRNVEGAEVTEDTLRGPAVEIAVADTGTGMAPEVSAHASEPFFTTKEIGKGSGLGLSQVFGFVEQSGGHVMIESQLGAGTTVRIVLPRALIQK
jgi:signal transduction histidine kinase